MVGWSHTVVVKLQYTLQQKYFQTDTSTDNTTTQR